MHIQFCMEFILDIISINEGGKIACYVPLRPDGTKTAVIWKDDLEYLERLGVPCKWCTIGRRKSVVVATTTGHPQIARLLTNAKPGERVCYADGNRLNLRRDNLVLEPCKGAARRHALHTLAVA